VTKVNIIRFDAKDFKCIPIGDHFYWITLDTIGPLLEINNGNMYILVIIDHYLKWCETKGVVDHDAYTITMCLKDEIICRFCVLKYVLTDNGNEWSR